MKFQQLRTSNANPKNATQLSNANDQLQTSNRNYWIVPSMISIEEVRLLVTVAVCSHQWNINKDLEGRSMLTQLTRSSTTKMTLFWETTLKFHKLSTKINTLTVLPLKMLISFNHTVWQKYVTPELGSKLKCYKCIIESSYLRMKKDELWNGSRRPEPEPIKYYRIATNQLNFRKSLIMQNNKSWKGVANGFKEWIKLLKVDLYQDLWWKQDRKLNSQSKKNLKMRYSWKKNYKNNWKIKRNRICCNWSIKKHLPMK